MKKLLSFIAMIAFVAGCGKSGDTIKVGFVGPMTGDAAQYGKLMSQAVKLAAEEKNAKGGIGGKNIDVIVEDDEAKVDKGNAAIEKLTGVDKIYGVVGAVFSSVSLAIAPKAEQTKTVMISPSSTHKDLPDKGDYIFRTIMSDSVQAKAFAKYIAKIAKIKRVAVLYIKNDYSQGLAEDFKTVFQKEGGVITAMETGVQGDKDFKTQLTKIKGTKPDALYIPNYVAEMAQMLEQADQLGLKVKILSADGFSNPEIFKLAGKLVEGVVFSNTESDNADITKNFKAAYKSKWGMDPDAFSQNAYDAANILFAAIEKAYNEASDADKKANKIDREKIKTYVAAVKNYPGVSGKVTFTANGDVMKSVGIFVAEKDSFKLLKKYVVDEKDNLVETK
jgi:branched-chain amino acid transport system substrate-binding protein